MNQNQLYIRTPDGEYQPAGSVDLRVRVESGNQARVQLLVQGIEDQGDEAPKAAHATPKLQARSGVGGAILAGLLQQLGQQLVPIVEQSLPVLEQALINAINGIVAKGIGKLPQPTAG